MPTFVSYLYVISFSHIRSSDVIIQVTVLYSEPTLCHLNKKDVI
jgi:hypothetical protein